MVQDEISLKGTEQIRLARRNSILNFEELLRKCEGTWEGDSEKLPLQHQFTPGLYLRTIFLPMGTVLTGKVHKDAHPVFLHYGIIELVTEFHSPMTLEGPYFFVSQPMVKRAAVAHTDVLWTTIHANPTDTQDLEQLEREIIAQDLTEYLEQ